MFESLLRKFSKPKQEDSPLDSDSDHILSEIKEELEKGFKSSSQSLAKILSGISILARSHKRRDKENAELHDANIKLHEKLASLKGPNQFKLICIFLLGTVCSSLYDRIFNDAADEFNLKYGIIPQRNLVQAQVPGRFVFSGDRLTGYGELNNLFSNLLKEQLGVDGVGYGATNGGDSITNLFSVKQFPRSLGFCQEDLVVFAERYDFSISGSTLMYSHDVSNVHPREFALAHLESAVANTTTLMKTAHMETVFIASNSKEYTSVDDLFSFAANFKAGVDQKLRIATASALSSGSYYTAQILADSIGSEAIEVVSCVDLNQAFEELEQGQVDICLFVEHPAAAENSLELLKSDDIKLLDLSDSAYRRISSSCPAYHLLEVDLYGLKTNSRFLGVRTLVQVLDLQTLANSVDQVSAMDSVSFRQMVLDRIDPMELSIDSKKPYYKVIEL